MTPPERATRRPVLRGMMRWGFLAAVVAATAWAFQGHGGEILRAVAATPLHAVLPAGALVVAGLLVTSVGWLRLLRGFGHDLPGQVGRSVFFLGQLGKYVPGGVWSIGAHAHLAHDHGVPARITASTSLAFLGLNVATATVVVGAVVATGSDLAPLTPGVGVLLVLVGLVALVPTVISRLAGLVAGVRLRLSLGQVAVQVGLMTVTWACYSGAVVLLTPDPAASLLPTAGGAFAFSYAVGVAVVVAPAGVGAREAALVTLLGPVVGLGAAGAVAVLTRLLHTGADLLLALVTWAVSRASSRRIERSRDGHGAVA